MLTSFGRQLVTGLTLLALAALLGLTFVTSHGRALTSQGRDVACRQVGICVEVHRR